MVQYSGRDSSHPQSLAIGDFNNDGRADIAVTNYGIDNVGVMLGYGNGNFGEQRTFSTGISSLPRMLVTGDFNNDSQPDIAVANYIGNNVGIFLGYGNGRFSSSTLYPLGDYASPKWLTIGDLNNDGRLDIITTNSNDDSLSILLGHVNDTFFNKITYTIGDNPYPRSAAVADFNNDGRLDIAVSNMLSENIGVFLGYVKESFASATVHQIGSSSQPVSIAVGDFNNDIRLDVVVADRGTNEVAILYGSGYGTFSGQLTYSAGDGTYPSSVAVGDFYQDNQLDIAVVNSGTDDIGVRLGYGDGIFSSLTTYSTGTASSPLSLAVGHFDKDDQLDIAVANYSIGNVCLLFGYGNGSFASLLCFTSGFGSHPAAVAFGDMNGDGSVDVVVSDEGFSTIKILSKIC